MNNANIKEKILDTAFYVNFVETAMSDISITSSRHLTVEEQIRVLKNIRNYLKIVISRYNSNLL